MTTTFDNIHFHFQFDLKQFSTHHNNSATKFKWHKYIKIFYYILILNYKII